MPFEGLLKAPPQCPHSFNTPDFQGDFPYATTNVAPGPHHGPMEAHEPSLFANYFTSQTCLKRLKRILVAFFRSSWEDTLCPGAFLKMDELKGD